MSRTRDMPRRRGARARGGDRSRTSAVCDAHAAAQSEGPGGRRCWRLRRRAIVINALFMQPGPHPSPIFGSAPVAEPAGASSAVPRALPRPRRRGPRVRAPSRCTADIQRESSAARRDEAGRRRRRAEDRSAAIHDFGAAEADGHRRPTEHVLPPWRARNASPAAGVRSRSPT